MQQGSGVRQRINTLREYIKRIESQLPANSSKQQKRNYGEHLFRQEKAPLSGHAAHLAQQISSLTERIERKRRKFDETSNHTYVILREPSKVLPFVANSYISKVIPQGTLHSIAGRISDDEWNKCCIYTQTTDLILVIQSTLEIIRFSLLDITQQQIYPAAKLLKFHTSRPQYFIILKISDTSLLYLWNTFIKTYQTYSAHSNTRQAKWQATKVVCSVPQPPPSKPPRQEQTVHQKKQAKSKIQQRAVQEKRRRESIHSVLNVKSEKKITSPSLEIPAKRDSHKIKEQLLNDRRGSFKSTAQRSRTAHQIAPFEPKKSSTVVPEMADSLIKLEQKRKKLIEEGQLNIHWDQNEEKVHLEIHTTLEKRSSMNQRGILKKNGFNLGKDNRGVSSSESKKDRSIEMADKKRNDSETRGEFESQKDEEKSISRGKAETSVQIRRPGQESTQYLKEFSQQNPGSATKKRSIRNKILKTLAEKSLIREEQSISSETRRIRQTSQLSVQDNKVHYTHEVSRINFFGKDVEEEEQESYESSDDKETSEFSMKDINELKLGVVVWKCSVNGWNPHEKKLYLADSDLEVCYCDILDSKEQKKFFFRDIVSVEYGKQGSGIIKHFGNVDEERCLIITIQIGEKKKLLEFYLGDNETVDSLKQFATKLKIFLEQKKRGESDDEGYQQ